MSQTPVSQTWSPRPLHPPDHPALAHLAARAFPPTQAAFVKPGHQGLVIDGDTGLAAAVLFSVITLPGGVRAGFVVWVMTDPAQRGHGHARVLVDLAVQRLLAQDCRCVLTEIEGHNTASQAVFRSLGFGRVGLGAQLAALGWRGAAVFRWRSGYTADPGHFLWLHGAAENQPAAGPGQRLGAWALNGALALLCLGLGGGLLLAGPPRLPGWGEAAGLLAAVALVLGLRESALRAAARVQGLAVEFRAWDSGLSLSLAIALLFGKLFPLPGSVLPRAAGWRHAEHRRALGRMAATGVAAVAAAVALAGWGAAAAHPGSPAAVLAAGVLLIGKPLLLFDTVMAFAPFQAFLARRVYEWHRGVWAGCAAVGLLLFWL